MSEETIVNLLRNIGVTDVQCEKSARQSAAETGLPEEQPSIVRGMLSGAPLAVWIYNDEIVLEYQEEHWVWEIDEDIEACMQEALGIEEDA